MRADPVVSQRLQQAAEQLQAAIRSARKRRQSVGDAGENLSGKAWQLPPTVLQTPDQDECEDDMVEEGSSDDKVESDATSLASGSMGQTPTKGEAETRTVEQVHDQLQRKNQNQAESDMRKALNWMQRDVERQARENRAVRETLARAIHDITDVVADFVDKETASVLVNTAAAATGVSSERNNNAAMLQLAPDKVDELVGLWDDALVSWREQNLVEKQALMEGFTQFEEECLARMKAGEVSHKLKEKRLVVEANQRQMICEDYTSSLSQQLESANCMIEYLQAQVANLSSQLTEAAAANVQVATSDAATETDDNIEILQAQPLDLAARAESSELHALRCEVAVAEQVQRANELEARLSMLLEECAQAATRKSVSPSEAVQTYRQKLELLEGRMQDVLQQVACDHEQFEYEQAKWALEKRHHREKYDEVLDASVKVLKVLIIREKLMKKNERMQKRVSNECQEKHLELTCQAATLQGITTELMQQSAMVLLVLQQLAVLQKSNTSQNHDNCSTWTLPAKPVQIKSMIKRLKKIEAVLGRRDWTSIASTADLISGTKVKNL